MQAVSTLAALRSGLIVFVATSTAVAQTATPDSPAPSAPAALEDTGCVSSDIERTNELFGRATSAWEQGDTADAVVALREAHSISRCSAFLFVLGEMLRQSGNECEALAWYERYVNDNPAVEKRSAAIERIAELGKRCPAPSVPTEVTPAPQVSPRAVSLPAVPPRRREARGYWTPARIGGVTSLGVSVLLGSGAVYFAVRAHDASQDYERLWSSVVKDAARGEEWQQRRAELERRGSSSATTAQILGGAAGALAIGGALLLLVNPGDKSEHDVALAVRPSELVARYGMRF